MPKRQIDWAFGKPEFGDTAMAKQLQQDYSSNSGLAMFRLPSIKAAVALSQGNPKRALEILDTAKPFELAHPGLL